MCASKVCRLLVVMGIVGLTLTVSAQQTDYVLGPQDVFSLTIWGPGGMSDRFTVEVDGTFTFPILGRVKAGGLTVRQLQDELTQRLRDGYFKDPRITITIEEHRSQHIFIIGEVKSPGTYNLTKPLTLLEALALAGSPTGNGSGVAVVRRLSSGEASRVPVTHAGPEVTEIRVDLSALQDGVLSNNPTLLDGDTIAVPRATPVYVFGHVNRPGEYTIGKQTTVRQILSLAGGVSQRGAAGRTKVIRVLNGNEQEFKVELDDHVMPGDTIVVPERFF